MLSFQKYSKIYIENESILVSAVNKLEYTDIKDNNGAGYYHYLAWSGNYDTLIKAIEEKKFDISIKNNYNSTIWHYLAWSGNYDMLIKAIKDGLCNISIENNNGATIWHFLAMSGNYDMLIKAINDNSNIDILLCADYNEDTIWHYLALSGNYEGLIRGIDDGLCDIFIKNKFGSTIWHFLAESGNYEALLRSINEKKFNKYIGNNNNAKIWHYFAFSGNYNDLINAIDNEMFDPTINDLRGDNIWDYLLSSNNYEGLMNAISSKRCNIKEFNMKKVNYEKFIHNFNELNKLNKIPEDIKSYILENKIPSEYNYLIKDEIDFKWDSVSQEYKTKIQEEYPDLICPISHDLALDPVVNCVGIIYSRKNIKRWYLKHNTDPYTNQKIKDNNLITVPFISNTIKKILDNYKE